MILSISESIQRLKAEIIAPDWRVSQKRAEVLETAFICLKQRYKNRKAMNAILTMVSSVLDYLKKTGDNSNLEAVDFLKEAMAHVVTLYESNDFEPEKEEKLFRDLFSKFKVLKEIINLERGWTKKEVGVPIEPSKLEPSKETHPEAVFRESQVAGDQDNPELFELMSELQVTLEKAQQIGVTLQQLVERVATLSSSAPALQSKEPFLSKPLVGIDAESENKVLPAEKREDELNKIKACPPTEIYQVKLGGAVVGVPEAYVARIMEINPERRADYLKNYQVPATDFKRFLRSLSKQFKGSLSLLNEKKLRQLNIPIIIPRGLNLPEALEEEVSSVMVLSNGNRHGAILSTNIQTGVKTMTRFARANDGDLAGIAYMQDGSQISLLDVVAIIKREGILLV